MCSRHLLRPAVTAALGLAAALLAAGALHAASDIDIRPDTQPQKKTDEIRIPIPGWSPEVTSNGCHVRRSPDEIAPDRQAGRPEVPFWGLIDARGRPPRGPGDTGQARGVPEENRGARRRPAPADAAVSPFGTASGATACTRSSSLRAAITRPRSATRLKEAGLTREHELFARAMALFGPNYPVDREVRAKPFGYSRPGGNLNAFDHALLPLARAFGSREALARQITGYVNRTPALFARIEALREKLGDNDRLRHLTDALARKIDWSKPAVDIARQLAALPREERHLIALWVFNAEFENGGDPPVLLQFIRRHRARGARRDARARPRAAGGDLRACARNVRNTLHS